MAAHSSAEAAASSDSDAAAAPDARMEVVRETTIRLAAINPHTFEASGCRVVVMGACACSLAQGAILDRVHVKRSLVAGVGREPGAQRV